MLSRRFLRLRENKASEARWDAKNIKKVQTISLAVYCAYRPITCFFKKVLKKSGNSAIIRC